MLAALIVTTVGTVAFAAMCVRVIAERDELQNKLRKPSCNHHYVARQVQPITVYSEPRKPDSLPCDRYTWVLLRCRHCHDHATQKLSGHWKLTDFTPRPDEIGFTTGRK